uniref:Uncharacterized protein n=1 Tax=Rubinisphaera brasiliensis (strain ATCC 49424 / DSM 5305 / JCM 21570 / IAM 15109 / NBRC 103401 / IFAM 1448) TaxID=756272 RepID=F0SJU1_RUBBR|nr:hypothetical protein Plabr_1009 [Rubinisphaera brasiliensis DSM 5305]
MILDWRRKGPDNTGLSKLQIGLFLYPANLSQNARFLDNSTKIELVS